MPVQPSDPEDEYFAKQEMRKRLEEQARRAAAQSDEEKKRLKELHYLHCPKCGTKLQEEVINEVTVDICPACHGVWLDDGELAKMTEGNRGILKSVRRLFA